MLGYSYKELFQYILANVRTIHCKKPALEEQKSRMDPTRVQPLLLGVWHWSTNAFCQFFRLAIWEVGLGNILPAS